MGLKLRKRTIPQVVVERRDLPVELADGKECWIKIEARAAGPVNDVWMAAFEEMQVAAAIMDAKAKEIKDTEKRMRVNVENGKKAQRQVWSVFADACLVSWSTNIIDDDTGKPIDTEAETFVELSQYGIPEIDLAFAELMKRAQDAGALIKEQDEETEKN